MQFIHQLSFTQKMKQLEMKMKSRQKYRKLSWFLIIHIELGGTICIRLKQLSHS